MLIAVSLDIRATSINVVNFIRFENMLRYGGKGILIIRNPYKAIVSWYRHLRQGVHSDTDFHVASQGGQIINYLHSK